MSHTDKLREDLAQLPLLFSQVREDPNLDLKVIKSISNKNIKVLMIASGGDTLCTFSKERRIESIDAVDANEAQILLTKLKKHLLSKTKDIRLKALGHCKITSDERQELLLNLSSEIGINLKILGPEPLLYEEGPDFAGRYEQIFKAIQREMKQDYSNLTSVFKKYFDLNLLIKSFGQEATQNPAQKFDQHFIIQTQRQISKDPNCEGPFLSQMLKGEFTQRTYDWLNFPIQTSRDHQKITYHQKIMVDFLSQAKKGEYDFIHLSNILDWLPPGDAKILLEKAKYALSPKGKIIIRQLNSSLEIDQLSTGLKWDMNFALKLLNSDESFFYKRILIAQHKR